jgi:hypothetical protein
MVDTYMLPIPPDKLIGINTTSSPPHVGNLANAIDLTAPIQTPVLAAADGTITYVKAYSNIGGADTMFWNYSNFIVIMHANHEYTRYDHLAFSSSKVIIGQSVRAGEEIARVGVTGYTILTSSPLSSLCIYRLEHMGRLRNTKSIYYDIQYILNYLSQWFTTDRCCGCECEVLSKFSNKFDLLRSW